MPYSECDLKWPAVVAIILLLIVFVCSIIGIASKYKAKSEYEDFACASGVVLDDLANGNVSFTDSSIFFVGIRTIDTELRALNNKINGLNT